MRKLHVDLVRRTQQQMGRMTEVKPFEVGESVPTNGQHGKEKEEQKPHE